jgi:regulatory protein
VAHAEDSSSVNVNITISIQEIERASAGILKIYLAEGPSFFVRDAYLSSFPADLLRVGAILPEYEAGLLLHAARVYLAERAAMEYLSRAEHSRQSLYAKLVKKEYTREEIAPALEYLEERGFLDDRRFASAWLRNRSIRQSEGRQKLLAGLLSRGISSADARLALDGYFEFADEKALCVKAAEKMVRIGKDREKMLPALIRKGFSSRLAAECLKFLNTSK